MNDALNKALIQGHEGLRLTAYRDTTGHLTVGYGSNLDAVAAPARCAQAGIDFAATCAGHGITPSQADALFDADYAPVAAQARSTFPKLDSYPENACAVLCDMLFELGLGGFLGFHTMILAVRAQDWAAAIAAIHDSKYASEVPGRVANNVALLAAIGETSDGAAAA